MSLRAPDTAAPQGLGAALRALGVTLAETIRVRGALLGLEAREELHRRERQLMLAALAVAFLHLSLLLLAALVTVAFWDTHRLAAIGAMALLYLACGAATLAHARRTMAQSPPPFAASLQEIERDVAAWTAPR